MGKKKKKSDDHKPWCYYCDRIFNDEATLVLHQKSKHFKCTQCNRKLSSAQGLVVHAYQVHKEDIRSVPGAKPGRDSIDIEIFGMAGVPDGMRPGDEEPKLKKARVEESAASSTPPTLDPTSIPMYPVATAYNPYPAPHTAQVPVPGAEPASHPGPHSIPYSNYGYSYGPPQIPPHGTGHITYQGAPQYPPPAQIPGLPPPGMMSGPPPHSMAYPPGPHMQPSHPGGMLPPPYSGAPGGPLGPGPLFPVTSQPGSMPPPGPLFPVTSHAPTAPLFPVAGASVGLQHNPPAV